MKLSLHVVAILMMLSVASSFRSIGTTTHSRSSSSSTTRTTRTTKLPMVAGGGKAWDNANYLDALGGNEEEITEAAEVYQEFSKSRSAFMARQKEYAESMSKTEAGRKALAQYQAMMEARNRDDDDEDDDGGSNDALADLIGSGGGSRLGHMMQKAKQHQNRKSQGPMSSSMKQFGFEQKFAVPLDDEDEES
jgi:hypothetical protein